MTLAYGLLEEEQWSPVLLAARMQGPHAKSSAGESLPRPAHLYCVRALRYRAAQRPLETKGRCAASIVGDDTTSRRASLMEFRQLGRSGFKVPVLSLGTGTFGGTNEFFAAWGSDANPRSDPARRHLPRRWPQHVRHRRHLFRQRFRKSSRRSHRGPPRQSDHLHQSHLQGRRRSERCGLLAFSPDQRDRRQPAPPQNRLHRSVPAARFRRAHSGGRSPRAPSTCWCAAEKSATSAAPIFPAGI